MTRPNVLIILNDDMGYSDIGCYGSEINTPHLDSLAAGGVRMTQFYNTARCCPSRASLLTGLHPHQADMGDMTFDDGVDGYLGDLSQDSATIAEVLRANGYATMMSGKWHVTRFINPQQDGSDHQHNWPCQRGFDTCYTMLTGASSFFAPKTMIHNNERLELEQGDFYLTDAISDHAVQQIRNHFAKNDKNITGEPTQPFFQYVAYTAPHWPLHAKPEDIEKYRARYQSGWDVLREERLARMKELGIIPQDTPLSQRDVSQPAFAEAQHPEWEAERMAVYAAQLDCMDQGIGRIMTELADQDQLDNTLILFLSDNGGCAEQITERMGKGLSQGPGGQAFSRDGKPVRYGNTPDITPGPEDTYLSYGPAWANASNTPFRRFKCWIHEGGIATPLIAHWPNGLRHVAGELRAQPAQLPDIMATILDVCAAEYPDDITRDQKSYAIQPHEGFSMLPFWRDAEIAPTRETLYWEHEGNCGIRRGEWKLVREYIYPGRTFGREDYETHGQRDWELYRIDQDRAELHNLVNDYPEIVESLKQDYFAWADRCQVIDHTELEAMRAEKRRAGKMEQPIKK